MGSQKICRKLFEKATRLDRIARCQVIAAIVKRNKILALGHNSYSSSALSRRFKKHEYAVYVHGEVAAIHNFLKKYPTRDLSKCDMYVVRVKRDKRGRWVLGKSKPCPGCLRAIDYFNLRKVIYE